MAIINKLIDFLKQLLGIVFAFLPDSPFQPYISQLAAVPFLGYINYFLPIAEMVAIGMAWLTAVGIYYVWQLALRWLKAIE